MGETALPAQLTAGTTYKFTASPASYPADAGWALTLYLAGVKLASFAGVPNGKSFDFTLDAATTATLGAGQYEWRRIASKAGEKYVEDSGALEVLADITSAEAGDFQSFAEKMVATIKAEIQRRVTGGIQSYQIHGRAAVLYTLDDLHKLLGKYEADVRVEQGGGFGTPVRMKFTGTASEVEAS